MAQFKIDFEALERKIEAEDPKNIVALKYKETGDVRALRLDIDSFQYFFYPSNSLYIYHENREIFGFEPSLLSLGSNGKVRRICGKLLKKYQSHNRNLTLSSLKKLEQFGIGRMR